MLREKARPGEHKNTYCCLHQIPKVANLKTAVVRPFITHLLNHPNETMKTCWWSKDELISDVPLWTPTHGYTSVSRPTKNYIHQLCTNTGCRLEELSSAMAYKGGWGDLVKGICAVSTLWWWWKRMSKLTTNQNPNDKDILKIRLLSFNLCRYWCQRLHSTTVIKIWHFSFLLISGNAFLSILFTTYKKFMTTQSLSYQSIW